MKNNKKGFTLAELLIVVAIIGVLIAIALPTFTTQLNNSKQATAAGNARSVYSEYVAGQLSESKTPTKAGLETAINAMTDTDKQGCSVTVLDNGNISVKHPNVATATVIETDL